MTHVWLLVVLTYNGLTLDPGVTYRSRTSCETAAPRRVAALAGIGIHGRWTCLRHGESQAHLAARRAPVREF